jgi:hypothetical protein
MATGTIHFYLGITKNCTAYSDAGPKVGSSRSADDVAVEFIKHDPTKPEEMSRYDRVVALIKPRQVNVVNANGLKPTTVVQKVAAQLAGKKFSSYTHVKC